MRISIKKRLPLLYGAIIGTLFCVSHPAVAGQYVRVSPDLVIHYEEAGKGQPIVFIPGWTGSTEYMRKQIAHFSKNYRVISYDPRSHGLSSKTLENNNYVQHGHDLKAFLDALELQDVIVAAHSAGCLDIYSYVREYGVDNLKATIAMDCAPPKRIWTEESDAEWSSIKDAKDLLGSYRAINYQRREVMPDFIASLHARELNKEEMDMYMGMVTKTPDYVATLLLVDLRFSDYTEEAKLIDANVPFLYVLPEGDDSTPTFQAAIKQMLPNTETALLPGKHNLHWEFPDKFNAAVDAFLDDVK